jgi:hypothetical protein
VDLRVCGQWSVTVGEAGSDATTVTDGRTQDLVASGELQKLAKAPAAYFVEYRDGVKAAVLMLDGR